MILSPSATDPGAIAAVPPATNTPSVTSFDTPGLLTLTFGDLVHDCLGWRGRYIVNDDLGASFGEESSVAVSMGVRRVFLGATLRLLLNSHSADTRPSAGHDDDEVFEVELSLGHDDLLRVNTFVQVWGMVECRDGVRAEECDTGSSALLTRRG
jgi:hypothetical protein